MTKQKRRIHYSRPFDLETAKKIQAGEIEGRIMCNMAEANIIDLDMRFQGESRICAQTLCNDGKYHTNIYSTTGIDIDFNTGDWLYIELQCDNEPQFKPFDKVLVTQNGWHYWIPSLYRNETPDGKHICIDNLEYDKCIPYEGNEHLIGTTDNPKKD